MATVGFDSLPCLSWQLTATLIMTSDVHSLGDSWNEAIDNAFKFGFGSFDKTRYKSNIQSMMSDDIESTEQKMTWMHNQYHVDSAINCCTEHDHFWGMVDVFYEVVMPVEEWKRYQREAAVAEDLHVAYETGAVRAMLDMEFDYDAVSMLKED